MSAPEEDPPPSPPPPPITITPPKHEDQDEIGPTMLGPTLAKLQELAADGKLTGGDIAGYLAVEQALAELREETWLTIPFEAATLIAEKLVGPARWGKEQAAKQAEAARPRDEKLQDLANERYSDPAIKPGTIAEDFLAKAEAGTDPVLRSLLVLKNADGDDNLMEDGETPRLIKPDTLRKIIAKRGERRK
jgi:hypothetical protein